MQQPLGAEGEEHAVGQGRRGPRTDAAHRLEEARAVLVRPQLGAGLGVVGDHRLELAALLLGEQPPAGDGERRPAGADADAPQLARRPRLPVLGEGDAGHHPVAPGSAKAGPFGFGQGLFETRSAGATRSRGEVVVLGRPRPAPGALGAEIAAPDPVHPHQGPAAEGEGDRGQPDDRAPLRPDPARGHQTHDEGARRPLHRAQGAEAPHRGVADEKADHHQGEKAEQPEDPLAPGRAAGGDPPQEDEKDAEKRPEERGHLDLERRVGDKAR